jgi:hypothetical protein
MAVIGNAPFQGLVSGGNILDASIEGVDLSTSAIAARLGYTPVDPGNAAFSATLTAKDIQQDNATYIKGKLAAGTATRLFGMNSSDTLYIGSVDANHTGGTLFVKNGVTQMSLSATSDLTVTGDLINNGGRVSLYRSAGASYIDWASGQSLLFRTETSAGGAGASTLMTIDSTGNIAIGKASASSRLHISGSSGVNGAAYTLDIGAQQHAWYLSDNYTSIFNIGSASSSSAWAWTYSGGEVARLATYGLGIGVQPSSQFSSGKSIEVGSAGNAFWSNGSNDVRMSANVKYNLHAATGFATTYVQSLGTHQWNTSASQVAGSAVAWNNGMVLNTSGNLGIGNTNPTMALGITKSSAYLDISNSDDTRYIDIGHWVSGQVTIETNNAPFVIKTQGSYPLRLQTAQTDRIYIAAGGNVGIGTTSPSYRLDVVTTSGPAAVFTAASGTTQQNLVQFVNSTNSGYTAIVGAGSNSAVGNWVDGSQIIEMVPATTGNSIISGYTGSLIFQTYGRNERMRIDSTGNVGINTTSPLSGGSAARWLTIAANTGNTYSGGIAFAIGGTNQCWAYQDTDNMFSHQGAGSNAGFKWGFGGTDYMRLKSSGLGIGVVTPGAKLHLGATSAGDSVFMIAGQGSTNDTVKFADVDIGGQGYGGSYLAWQRDGSYGNDLIINTRNNNNSNAERMRVQRDGKVSIGTGGYTTADGGSTLIVAGPVSVGATPGRFIHAWWQGATDVGYSYLHIRTSLWGGGATYGNRDYIMGGFHIMGYKYTTPGNIDQWIQFHNWSGTTQNAYNKTNAGNLDADNAAYVDSTGYVTLRLASSQYQAYTIDFHQTALYPVRTVVPTAFVWSNSATI